MLSEAILDVHQRQSASFGSGGATSLKLAFMTGLSWANAFG